MISDLCDRNECETCFEDELDACAHECHNPLDCPAGEARLTTEYTGTGRAADPAAGFPRSGCVARASVPGGPSLSGPPLEREGGKTSTPKTPVAALQLALGAAAGTDPASLGTREGAGYLAGANPPAGPAILPGEKPGPGRGDPGFTPPRPGQGAGTRVEGLPRSWVLELPAGMEMLSLNGREHWAERARRTEALKTAAWAVARQANIPMLDRVSVVVEYQPPDRRRRDAENICAASGKAAIDGLVAAGVLEDDACPRYVTEITCRIGERYPKGRLVLIITEVAP